MIETIKIRDLMPFEGNPFQVKEDMELEMLIDSIAQYGVLNPIIVRQIDGGYEVISGQRRIIACEILGLDEVPAIVKNLDKDMATIMMVDSNLQREKLLPSEKAFAYKMKLDAIRRQGCREHRGGQSVHKSRDEVSDSESGRNVQRYVRLTYLEPELLKLVDDERIALTPAVELSYLPAERQKDLFETIQSEQATPSLSQAKRMRSLEEKGKLSMDSIFAIMTEEKGNQTETIKLPVAAVRKYFRRDSSYKEMQDTIIKALDDWFRRRQRDRNDNCR